jgi:hypothetical protein
MASMSSMSLKSPMHRLRAPLLILSVRSAQVWLSVL